MVVVLHVLDGKEEEGVGVVAVKPAKTGLWIMLLSMILSEALSLGSLVLTRWKLSPGHASGTTMLSFLSFLAVVLEIAAIALMVAVRRVRRLAVAAAMFFIAWAILNLAVYTPLVFIGVSRGSIELVKLGLGVKAAAAILQYSIPLLLAYGLARSSGIKRVLWLALVLAIVGGLGILVLPILSVRLEQVVASSGKLYVPKYEVEYASWPYPILLLFSHLGGILYMVAYAIIIRKLVK